MLIAARAVQGLGGAVIAPASLSILTTTFTEGAARNRAVGIWGAMGGAGGAAGVLLGGVITDLLSWRWILFINVPIGLIAAFAAQRCIAGEPQRRPRPRVRPARRPGRDPSGSRCWCSASSAPTRPAGAPSTLVLIGAGLALLGVFVVIEGRFARAPLMPLRIYRSRTLSAANVVVLLVGGAVVRDVVLRLALPAAGARLLPDPRRARLPADDAVHRRRLDAGLAAGRPRRRQAAAHRRAWRR